MNGHEDTEVQWHSHMADWAGEDWVWSSEDFLRQGRKTPARFWVQEETREPSEVLLDSYEPERLHTHVDFLELFYVQSGRGVAFLDGAHYILQKGDILCIRPGQVHANFPLEDLMIYNCIIANAALEADCSLPLKELSPFLHLTGKTLLEVENIYEELLLEKRQKAPHYQTVMKGCAYKLCVCLLRFQAGNQSQLGRRRAITPLLEYLSEHFATVTLEELAKVSSYSASYLSHLFRETFGLSFTEYVNILRVNRAAALLQETSLTVEEIGLEVGIHSRKHFYDIFKRHMGMTPGAFRGEP